MSQSNEITFEAGYARLQTIARRLGEEEVPVSEMCDLFAEGKGLEQALTGYLDEQRQRIESIDRGEGVRAFRVVAAAGETGGSADQPGAPRANSSAPEDDIPF